MFACIMHPAIEEFIYIHSTVYQLSACLRACHSIDHGMLLIRPASPIILCKSNSSHMLVSVSNGVPHSIEGSNLDSPIYNRVPVDLAPEYSSLHPRIAPKFVDRASLHSPEMPLRTPTVQSNVPLPIHRGCHLRIRKDDRIFLEGLFFNLTIYIQCMNLCVVQFA